MDRKECATPLLAEIEALPRDVPSGPYWCCHEVYIAGLAAQVDDPRVWPALEKAARRASIGLRMELLNKVTYPEKNRHRKEVLQLLARFLNEAAVRKLDSASRFDMHSKFSGPCPGFTYDRIEVRAFVALELASLLDIPADLKPDRTAEEWAKMHWQVREALKREPRKAG